MRPLISRIARFLKAEDGPTAVEYAIMLSMILLACLLAVVTAGKGHFRQL